MSLFKRFVFSFFVTGILLPAFLCPGADADLSVEGSHKQFIETVESSQKIQFKETVAGYDEYLVKNPDDSIAATELCLFISFFTYSEDITIEAAGELLEKSEAYLDKFKHNPVVELYRLDQLYGEPLIEKGESLLKDGAIKWSDSQLSSLHLKLASQYSYEADMKKSGTHALKSLETKPTASAQLLAAEYYKSTDEKKEGIAVLQEIYPDEVPYQKKQRMTLLSDLGASSEALVVLRELTKENTDIVSSLDSARVFATGGLVEDARLEFGKAKDNSYNPVVVAEEYLTFEMEYGTGAQAMQAYTNLRDLGFENDPLLYHRFNLLMKDSGQAWQWRDALGGLALLALILIPCVVPLLWLIPVHYWGLLRKRAGKPGLDLQPDWSMRNAWAACGFFFFISILMSYLFTYELVFDPLFDEYASDDVSVPDEKLAWMLILSDLVLLLGIGLIAGFRKSYLSFIPEHWTGGKALGMAIVWYIPLRVLAGILTGLPGVEEAIGHLEVSITQQSLLAVNEELGPWALILSLAVLTPIIEEVIFRGVLLTSLVRHIPFWAANILQAGLFTIMHEEVQVYLFLFAFGLVTGLMRKQSGGLLASILLHVINNGIVALVVISAA